jgi:hypothetical protein
MADVPVSIILHDIARAHTVDTVKDLLHHWQWEILEHLSYPSDMSQCDYDLSLLKNERTTARAMFKHKRGDYLCCRVVTAGLQLKWMQ